MDASSCSPNEAFGKAPGGRARRELLARAHGLKAHLAVGRGGLSDGFVSQVAAALGDTDLVKVRIEAEDREEATLLAGELAQRVGAELLQRVGRVAVLYRRGTQRDD